MTETATVRCSECPYDTVCRQSRVCTEILHRLLDKGVKPRRAQKLASINT